MTEIELTVGGMSCMGCVNSVKRLLEQLPGVTGSDIDLASGRARVRYEPGQVSPEAIRQAIADGGYPVAD